MEQEYLERIRSGETHLFRYFVEKYQGKAFGLAVGIVRDTSDAEEVVQDAFLKAFKGLKDFRGDATFSTWLYRIVVREALQKARRRRPPSRPIEIAEAISPKPEVANALQLLETRERKKLVASILDQLPPNERLVLRLFYLEEQHLDEIVAITPLSRSNIKTLLHRARKRFYTLLHSAYRKELFL